MGRKYGSFVQNRAIIRKVTYIPSKKNHESDQLSRMSLEHLTDWGLSEIGWQLVNHNLGPFTVDRFATSNNRKVPRFCSRVWESKDLQEDAFLDNWKEESNFVNPPLGMISPVLSHIIRHKAKATLIVPEWTQSIWWAVITRIAKNTIKLNKDIHLIGHQNAEIWKNNSWRFVAIQVDGTCWEDWINSKSA